MEEEFWNQKEFERLVFFSSFFCTYYYYFQIMQPTGSKLREKGFMPPLPPAALVPLYTIDETINQVAHGTDGFINLAYDGEEQQPAKKQRISDFKQEPADDENTRLS